MRHTREGVCVHQYTWRGEKSCHFSLFPDLGGSVDVKRPGLRSTPALAPNLASLASSSRSLPYIHHHFNVGWALAAAAWLTCWLLSIVCVGLKSMEAPES